MECLTAIGNGVVGKIAEYTVGRQVGYIIYYNRNLKKLQNQVRDLDAARESVEHKIVEEKRKGRKVETFVTNWLTDVNKITGDVKDFLKDEHQAKIKCLYGFCPNLMARHNLSRKSTKLVQEVAELYGKKDVANIAYNVTLEEISTRWEVGRAISAKRSNSNLEELKNLHRLTTLQIHIPDANMLPANLFISKLERFQICIGSAWKWDDVDEALNALKLQLTTMNELDEGLKMLLNRTEDLYLEGTEGVNNSIVYQLGPEGFQKVKHLHVQNNAEFANVINGKVGFPNLTWLAVSELNGLRFLLSSSMARSLAQLKRLQISRCQIMEAIVSIEESDEEIAENIFCQLQDLELKDLANLTQFCSSISYTKMPNPSFERLQLQNSSIPNKFTFDSMNISNAICEIEESDPKGNHDKKVQFPNLKELFIDGLPKLTTIWNNQFSIDCSKNLESIEIGSCESLKSIFPASVARSLQQLRRLIVRNSGVEEIISNKDELLGTATFVFSKLTYLRFQNLPQLKSFYPGPHDSNWPSLATLAVFRCEKVQIFAKGKCELKNHCTSNKQSLFLLEKDSFPDLEYLGLSITENWDCPPLHLFRKLKALRSYVHSNSSVSSLEKLLGLEILDVTSNGEIQAIENGTLPHLRQLYLHGMRKLTHLGEDNSRPTCPNFPNLEILELMECDSLKNLRSSAISYKILTTLQVSFCKSLKYLVTYSMAKSLMQLAKLEVEDCEEIIEIVESNESNDSRNEIEFKCLKHLKLSALPRLRGFCSRTRRVTFPSLETLSMNCTILETFIFDPMGKSRTIRKEIEERNSKKNLQTMAPHFLFDKKVGFPSLKNLSIKGISKLTTIWHNQLAPDSFCKLTEVEVNGCGSLLNIFVPSIGARLNSLHTLSVKECESVQEVFEVGVIDVTELHGTPTTPLTPLDCQTLELVEIVSCESLKSIFPALMARSLQQLRSLTVKNCGVEEIFSNKDGLQTTPMSIFSKLTHVRFENLPQLRCVYPGLHASNWPSLNVLAVYGCDKVQIFAERKHELYNLCTPNKQSLILVEKDSFPNLEELSLDVTENWDSQSLHLFRKLKSLRSYVHSNSSVDSLEKLLGLEKVNVGSNGEIHAVGNGTLPHLRELYLYGMRKLMHLGEDSSRPTYPNFPNLEFLELKECDSLKNLRSSTISFKTLTTLQVRFCKSLKYLVTYSIAKSLMQLAKLEVEDCEEIIEIVESNESDDSGNVIEFKCLKHLKLFALPRLRWFCSGTGMVTFPFLETLSMNCTLLDTFIFDPMGKRSTIRK